MAIMPEPPELDLSKLFRFNNRSFFATIEYSLNGKMRKETIKVRLPEDCSRGEQIIALREEAARKITNRDINYVLLCYRLDGSDKPLTFIEAISDLIYSITFIGKPITRNEFVPIWPRC